MTEKRAPKPTSAKQVEANRGNAGKSAGPTGEEGKKNSARNAMRSGIYAQTLNSVPRGQVQGFVDLPRGRGDITKATNAPSMASG